MPVSIYHPAGLLMGKLHARKVWSRVRVIREKVRELHKIHICVCAHRPTAGPSEKWEEGCWEVIKRKAFYNEKL